MDDYVCLRYRLGGKCTLIGGEAEDGRTQLMWYSGLGDYVKVKSLLDAGDCIDHPDKEGYIALSYAIIGHHPDVVQILIKCGSDPNHKDKFGYTALNRAIFDYQPEIIQFLLTRNANVNSVDKYNISVFEFMCLYGDLSDIETMLAYDPTRLHKNAALVTAVPNRNVYSNRKDKLGTEAEVAALLLNNSANVNAKESESWRTCLHFAAENGLVELCELLISRGAEINVGDKVGYTPLDLAVSKVRVDVVDLLLKSGAEISDLTRELAKKVRDSDIDFLLKQY